jgi:pimeloyl-ACP methyl ester carboxylesterase
VVEGIIAFLETRDARNWQPLDGRSPIFRQSGSDGGKSSAEPTTVPASTAARIVSDHSMSWPRASWSFHRWMTASAAAPTMVSAQSNARVLAATLPSAKLVLLKDVGHMPHHAAPEVVANAIEELMSGVALPSASMCPPNAPGANQMAVQTSMVAV